MRTIAVDGKCATLGVFILAALGGAGCSAVPTTHGTAVRDFPLAELEPESSSAIGRAEPGGMPESGVDPGEIELATGSGRGATPVTPVPADDGWNFSVAPYFWAPSVNGHVTVRGNTASADESFSDLLDDLDGAIFARLAAWNGEWGLFVQPQYMALTANDKVAGSSIHTDLDLSIVDFGVMNRTDVDSDGDTLIDASVGGRYWKLDADTKANPPGVSASASRDWVDLILGLSLTQKLGKDWQFLLAGDVGGWDIGSSATKDYSGTAAFGYEVNPSNHLWFGWKTLQLERSTGGGSSENGSDLGFTGPIFGWQFQF